MLNKSWWTVQSSPVTYPGIFFLEGGGVSTNSVEDRGQRERGSGGVAVTWYKKFHFI